MMNINSIMVISNSIMVMIKKAAGISVYNVLSEQSFG